MPNILPLTPKLEIKLIKYNLIRKYNKQISLLTENPRHPSLNIELLEPKERGIYSFRIDLKFRALFFFNPIKNAIQIIAITVHYH